MGKYLVKFSRDWADEFTAEGMAIYTEEDKARLETLLEEGNFEWYFGTNEGYEEGELEIGDFTFTEISEEEILFLQRLIPDLVVTPHNFEFEGKMNTWYSGGSFGQIPSPEYLSEAILNTTE